MSKPCNPRIKTTGPKRAITHMVYRITIGDWVYVGCTQNMHRRAQLHISTPGRRVYDAFHNSTHDMVVEYITGSNNYVNALKLEAKHIKLEHEIGRVHV